MMTFIEHVTGAMERWDTLAYRFYGDGCAFQGIIDANPEIALDAVLPVGTLVRIPVLAQSASTVTLERAPWH